MTPSTGDDRPIEVEAAGAILVDDAGRICVVHRPHRDDWSLPKGKLEEGEEHREAALREVLEETGFVGDFRGWIGDLHYDDNKGRFKRVRYAEMAVTGGEFAPNDEVDQLAWMEISDAVARLSYPADVGLVRQWASQRGG